MTANDRAGVERIDYATIVLEFAGPLATLTLNDADRLNAMGVDMANEIAVALNEVVKPRRRCRALLITGAGRGFCAGVNLMGSRAAVAAGAGRIEAIGAVETLFHPLLRRLHGLQIPVIVGVNGLAIGIGLGMVLAADYVVAAESAWFQAPFKNLASASDSGLAWLLSRIIGPVRTKRVLMRAERIDARTALDWGMIAEVAAADELADRARAVALEFANDATIALGEIKRLINDAPRSDFHSALEAEAAAVGRTSRTRDNVAAIRVFGTKTRPEFTGE